MKKEEVKLIRSFFAIAISTELRDALHDIVQSLKKLQHTDQVKWTKKENWHLTLCFIGEIPEEKVVELQRKIKEAFKEKKAFSLPLGKINHFPPNHARPHALVLHLPLIVELMEIVKILESVVASCDLAIETRPYLPHITLARLPRRQAIDLSHISLKKLPTQLPVEEIIFYQSEQSEHGSIYSVLKKISLSGKDNGKSA